MCELYRTYFKFRNKSQIQRTKERNKNLGIAPHSSVSSFNVDDLFDLNVVIPDIPFDKFGKTHG